jgi:hypothetical protein
MIKDALICIADEFSWMAEAEDAMRTATREQVAATMREVF